MCHDPNLECHVYKTASYITRLNVTDVARVNISDKLDKISASRRPIGSQP